MTNQQTTRQRIAIIDYGMGNLHSVTKALERIIRLDPELADRYDVLVTQPRGRYFGSGKGGIAGGWRFRRLHAEFEGVWPG